MAITVYNDPTFNAVLGIEIREKNCAVCERGGLVFDGQYRCKNDLHFPRCRRDKNRGFKLVDK